MSCDFQKSPTSEAAGPLQIGPIVTKNALAPSTSLVLLKSRGTRGVASLLMAPTIRQVGDFA